MTNGSPRSGNRSSLSALIIKATRYKVNIPAREAVSSFAWNTVDEPAQPGLGEGMGKTGLY
jgi:hypothetical protein